MIKNNNNLVFEDKDIPVYFNQSNKRFSSKIAFHVFLQTITISIFHSAQILF